MAKIAYLLLCHRNADRVLEQARILTARGDVIAVHVDARAGAEVYSTIAEGLADNPGAVLARRQKCGWGEWSLVQATLNMITAAMEAFEDATHFFLISGDCMPTKPSEVIRAQLAAADQDWIEHADFFEDGWIKTGMQEDRLIYRHWFNERKHKGLFYGSYNLQKRLGLDRNIPHGLRMRIGSQWWVLRRETLGRIRAFLRERPDILRFFRTTWIPDETFFQTLTMHLVPREEVRPAPPTFLMFSDYGMPVTFCADHFDLLRTQGCFFARKISDHDDDLRRRLGDLFISDAAVEETVDTGRALYDYVRQRGRIGQRFAPRAWDAANRLGPERELVLVICKKWHLGKAFADALRAVSGLACFGYVFDEDEAGLPPLGNLEANADKRNRHRRAILNLIYGQCGADKIVICLDPAQIGALRDFAADGCRLRVLEIGCDLDADWFEGHAERVGLGRRSDAGALHRDLMHTLKVNIEDELSALRAMGLPGYRSIAPGMTAGAMARPIAEACGISIDAAGQVAHQVSLSD